MWKVSHCLALAILGTSAPVLAQIPSYASLPVSPNPNRIFLEATIAVVHDGAQIHTFSTFTKKWYTLPLASASPQFFGYDDHVIVEDGMRLWGLGTRQGVYRPIDLSAPAPNVLSAPAPTWLSVVIDGNDVHFFSAFTGTWATASFSSTPFASIDKLTGMASDGIDTYAYSAHFGTIVPLGTAGVTSVRAAGYCGYAESPNEIHCYSATRNTWAHLPATASSIVATPTLRTGTLLIQDPTTYRFWSAFTTQAVSIPRSGAELINLQDHASVVIDGTQTYAYASATGTVTARTFATSPFVSTFSSYHFVLDDSTGNLAAFSGVTGGYAADLPAASGANVLSHPLSAATAVQDLGTGDVDFYSAMTNRWTRAPHTPGGTISITYAGGVLLNPAGGMHGFAAMHDSFTTMPSIIPTNTYQFGGNFAAVSGARIDVFNPQLPAWRTQLTSSQPTSLILHHAAVMAQAGNDAYFYGTYDDRWTHLAFPNTPFTIGRSDELGFINTGTAVIGLGASGQTTNLAIFPEFWRVLTRGSRTEFHIAGEGGAGAWLILGISPANIPIPSIGTLLIDLATAVILPLAPLPAVGTLPLSFTVPGGPEFQEQMIHAQSLIWSPGSPNPYLTNVYRSVVY